MKQSIGTDSVAISDRVDWWQERAANLFGAHYSIEPNRETPFSISLNVAQAAPLVLFTGNGSAHRATRKDTSDKHACIVAHLQLQGHCTVRAEGKESLIAPGRLTFHRVRESNDLHFHEDYRQICAVLPESVLDPEFGSFSLFAGADIPTESGTAALLADHLRSLASHPETLHQESSAAEISSYTIGLIRSTLRVLNNQGAHNNHGLRDYHRGRIKRFALAHLHQPGLSVDFISAAVSLSPRYIHRIFEEESMPLMQWVMKKRLERAHEQLGHPDCRLSICEIAYAWGFSDHAHFSRSFQKQFGYSPREARLKAKASTSR